MSSINDHYTFSYSQPSEYRLSHDSVFLSRNVYECLGDVDLNSTRALDICAGSGIVGMDFLFHRRAANKNVPAFFDFLEVQNIYYEHFVENQKRLGKIDTQLSFLNRNYNDLQAGEFSSMYDLIVCNPPYFLPTQGKLSPSEFKNRCRFFIDSDLKNLLFGIFNCLKKKGVCYMILRDLSQHGWSMFEEAQKISEGQLKIKTVGDIRGTRFLRLTSLKN